MAIQRGFKRRSPHAVKRHQAVPRLLPYGRLAIVVGLAFIYGSLIPFETRALSFDAALDGFSQIRYLNLGLADRADWVANGVILLPFGFFVAASCERLARGAQIAIVSISTLILAISVEFVQQWFVPRTVSLNDILAELAGGTLGMVAWVLVGPRLAHLASAVRGTGIFAATAGLVLYTLAYVCVSLYPLDVVVTLEEFESVLNRKMDGIWQIPAADRSPIHAIAMLVVAAAASAPIGVLYALKRGVVAAAGLAISTLILIEVLQIPVAGVQFSLPKFVAAVVGSVCGAWLFGAVGLNRIVRTLRPVIDRCWPFVAIAYGATVAHFSDLTKPGWMTLEQGWDNIKSEAFIPFYYAYFTTEVVAVSSVLFQVTMYAPVGIMSGLLGGQHPGRWAGTTAAFLAFIVEGARQFKPGLRGDPTNILVAFVGAAAMALIVRRFKEGIDGHRGFSDAEQISSKNNLVASLRSIVGDDLAGRLDTFSDNRADPDAVRFRFETHSLTGEFVVAPPSVAACDLGRQERARLISEVADMGGSADTVSVRRRSDGRYSLHLYKLMARMNGEQSILIRILVTQNGAATLALSGLAPLDADSGWAQWDYLVKQVEVISSKRS